MTENNYQIFTVLSVNVSEKKGTIKVPVNEITVTKNGIAGDAHSGDWNRQVSILGLNSIEKFIRATNRKTSYGEFAENITVSGINLDNCMPLNSFKIGDTLLEITQIGKECHGSSCAIYKEVGNCIMPKEGIFTRVINPGIIRPGDTGLYLPKIFRIYILTLSDRASKGIYEDKSGPGIKSHISDFFAAKNLRCNIETEIIPDDAPTLREIMIKRSVVSDIIFTTGGTGIGPKDITPDVIRPMLNKEIPGIMDLIRLKYSADKPQALLSRSFAGIIDNCLVYSIPGSLKAVEEYMEEILKTLLHTVYMLHELDIH